MLEVKPQLCYYAFLPFSIANCHVLPNGFHHLITNKNDQNNQVFLLMLLNPLKEKQTAEAAVGFPSFWLVYDLE